MGKMARHTCTILVLLGLLYGAAAQESALTLGEFQATVLGSDGSKLISAKGSSPSVLLSSPQIASTHTLDVSGSVLADGKEFKAQQVMLAFVHKQTGLSATAVGKLKKGSTYAFSVTPGAIEKQIGKLAGEYTVTLLVGDPSISQGIQWQLGVVELVLPEADGKPLVRTVKTQPSSNQKPIINHIFRQPEKRPPAIISLVFTALVFLPLLAVIGYVMFSLNVNFNAWPKDASTGLYALLFHGLIAALLSLYLFFWLKWNLADTLPVALVLGAALAFVGHRALSGLATARLQTASKRD